MAPSTDASDGPFWTHATPERAASSWPANLMIGLAVAAAMTVAAALALWLQPPGVGTATFWPAAGVMVGVTMATRGAMRAAAILGGTGALAVVDMLESRDVASSIVLIAANVSEALAITLLMERRHAAPLRLERLRSVLTWLAVTVGVVASVGVPLAIGLKVTGHASADLQEIWWVLIRSHTTGIVAIAPAIAATALALRERDAGGGPHLEGLAILALLIAVALVTIGQTEGRATPRLMISISLLYPVAVWLTARASATYSALGLLAVSTIVVWQASRQVGASADQQIAAQAFVFSMAVAMLTLGAIFEQAREDAQQRTRSRDEAVRARTQLVAAEARTRRLINATPSSLWTATADGTVEWISDRWYEFTGSAPGDTRAWLDCLHPDDRTRFASAWAAGIASGSAFQIERRTRGADGGYRWFLTQASPEHGADGAVGGWIGSITDIDDLKRGEAHRLRLDQLISRSSDLIAISDAGGRLTYLNEAGRRLIGVTPDGDVSQLRLTDYLTAKSRELHHEQVVPALKIDGHWEGEMQLLNPRSGTVTDVQRSVSRLRDESGRIVGYASVMRDITAAKRTESVLRENEARYRAALQAGRMGSWETDLIDGVRIWSPEGMALFGIDLPGGRDVLGGAGDRWLGSLHPDDRHLAATFYRLARTQDSFAAEYRIVRPDGVMLWLSGRGRVAERLADGRPRRLVSVMADVSDRETALAALRESEDRFRSMATMAHEGIWTVDRRGRTTFVNPRMADLLRVPIERLSSQSVIDYCFPQDVAEAWRRIDNSCAGVAEQFECRFRRADGTPLYVLAATSPLRGRDGQIIGALGGFLDLTEWRRAEEAEREIQAQLRHAADAAGLTHLVVDHDRGSLWAATNHKTVLGFELAADAAPVDLASGIERFLAHVAEADRPRLRRMLSREGADMRGAKVEYRLRDADGREHWIESTATDETLPRASQSRIFSTHLDVTQRKAAEDHVKLLLHEVNHRAKNLLTVVLSIARQTARESHPEEFARYFSERLQGLSASQDLIILGNWHGVSMDDLAQSQLHHLGKDLRARLTLHGDAITLTPPAAQGLGMALHELATNALKYGALASPAGRIELRWEIVGEGADRRFRITWTERGGPPVVPPTRHGFGRTVIERMAALAVDGQVDLSYAPEGVRWRLEAPADAVCAVPPAA